MLGPCSFVSGCVRVTRLFFLSLECFFKLIISFEPNLGGCVYFLRGVTDFPLCFPRTFENSSPGKATLDLLRPTLGHQRFRLSITVLLSCNPLNVCAYTCVSLHPYCRIIPQWDLTSPHLCCPLQMSLLLHLKAAHAVVGLCPNALIFIS